MLIFHIPPKLDNFVKHIFFYIIYVTNYYHIWLYQDEFTRKSAVNILSYTKLRNKTRIGMKLKVLEDTFYSESSTRDRPRKNKRRETKVGPRALLKSEINVDRKARNE